jgi:hypothetical protein
LAAIRLHDGEGLAFVQGQKQAEPGAILRGKGREADGDTLAVDVAERLDVVIPSQTAIQGTDDIAARQLHGSVSAGDNRTASRTIPEGEAAPIEATAHLQPVVRYQQAIFSLAD